MSGMSLHDVVPGLQPADPGGGRRASSRARERRRRRKRRRALLVMLLSVLLVGGGIAASYVGLAPLVQRLTEPNDYAGPGTGEVEVKIQPGASGRAIAKVLADAGVIKTPKAFVDASKLDSRTASIQPGTYRLKQQMSASAAIAALLDPEARLTLSVTVPEGKRWTEVVALLTDKLGLDRAAVVAALKGPGALGLSPAVSRGSAEGFLWPSTYDFEPDVTVPEVLTKMVSESAAALNRAQVPPDRWREVVIKASIVQAEAGRTEDMGKVARVIENRLARGRMLQMDSTVNYATGKTGITTSAQDRASTSRYNTYKYTGLPIGPINSPGMEAIEAVLEPTPGDWLFFVTVNPDTGETRFAETEAQHAANVEIYRAWLRRRG